MTRIGFVGLGRMGRPMAGHILKGLPAADQLLIHDVTSEHLGELIGNGAVFVDSADQLGARCQIVIFMVPDIPQIRAVCEGGLVAAATEPVTVVVCSTVAPDAVRSLDADLNAASDGRVRVIDAPVSGGEVGAIAGTLSIMVGGEEALVEPVMPYLKYTGNPVHLGPLGAGEVAKACNQLICAATMVANAEAAVVAERAGLDVAKLFDLLQGGYAASKIMTDKAPRFANKDYTVSGAAWLWIKDLGAYLDEAERTGTRTVQGDRLRDAYQQVVDQGMGELDSAVIQKWIAEREA